MSRPCNLTEYIFEKQPGAADHDGPTSYCKRDGDKRTNRTWKAILGFRYRDRLLHSPAQIGAQAARWRDRWTDGQEGSTERSAMVVLSGFRCDLIWRSFHIRRCKGITRREQATIHLGLILSRFGVSLQSAAFFLRRLLLSLGRNDLNRHGIPSDQSAFSRARPCADITWRLLPAAETILPAVPA